MGTAARRSVAVSALVISVLLGAPLRAQETIVAPVAAAPVLPAAAPVPMDSSEPKLEDFAPLPGNVPWPTLQSTTDGEAAVAAGDVRYNVDIKGLAGLGLEAQFRSLSSLWTKRSGVSNLAQINRRVIEDRDLIDQLLRSIGHYGGNTAAVITPPAREGDATRVSLIVEAGPVYTFDSIAVAAPADATNAAPAAVVTPLLGVTPGDAVDAARVNTAQDTLAQQLADKGFPFPVVGKPEIVIDHATRTASLVQTVDLGARGVFGALHITGETQGFDDKHLAILARFKPGQPYNGADREDLRRALIQTGLFGSVDIKPVKTGPVLADGSQAIDMIVNVEASPVRTVAATGGYSTGQGIRLEGSWAHRNLFKPEGGVTFRGVAAEREQVLSAEFRRRNFRRRDQSLTVRAGLSAEQQDAFDATTFGIDAAVVRESNIIWQKPWTYSVGVEALVTRQRDRSAPTEARDTYFILALPGSVTWDQSDDLLNPARGFRLTGRVSPEFTLRSGRNLNYVRGQVEATAYQPFGNIVLAADQGGTPDVQAALATTCPAGCGWAGAARPPG